MESQARMLFRQIVLTRRWIADHGGILLVENKGQKPNPYLPDTPEELRRFAGIIAANTERVERMVNETLELLARIRACLRRAQPPEATIMSCGDLYLDPSNHLVTLLGHPLDLTPKEFDLLYLLMESHGKVLSREAIRRALWKGSKLYSWSRVIDVHIQHLRQKIETDPSTPVYIHTVAGVGYRCCLGIK